MELLYEVLTSILVPNSPTNLRLRCSVYLIGQVPKKKNTIVMLELK